VVATSFSARSFSARSFSAELGGLDASLAQLRRFVHDLCPGELSGQEAMAAAERLGQLEKVVASGLALLSPRVIETGVFAQGGHASAPDWLAAVSGSSAGAAKSRLASAERAAVVPALSNALHEGQLSAPQLGLLSGASAADPGAVGTLLELVERQVSHQEMTEEANRLKAAARSKECERARRQRVHEERHLRWHQHPEGGIRGDFSCDEIEWARIAARLMGIDHFTP